MSLIPTTPGSTPNYWCTWGIQNYSLLSTDLASWSGPARNLDEGLLFHTPGWASQFFDKIRGDLYLLFDAGWDLPLSADADSERWRLGALLPDPDRFPSCAGTAAERQRCLNELCTGHGWRGAGLWVAPQVVGDGKNGQVADGKTAEAWWRDRARWSHRAGIEYWKIDTGHGCASGDYRRRVTDIVRQEAPNLTLEHALMGGPLNDDAPPWEPAPVRGDGRFRSFGPSHQRALEFLAFSDVLRTYDVTAHLSPVTTLDRVATLLAEGRVEPGFEGLLNCEDEPYLAAGLGCATGILRHPLWQPRPGSDYDPGQYGRRIDETIRAVRWQRVAPAFGVGTTPVTLDERLLEDRWRFRKGDTWAWWVIGREVCQRAPARVARGLPLPRVSAAESPFVVASRHPNGAVAVATLSRISTATGIHHPLAEVTLEIPDASLTLGVLGRYRSLTLDLAVPLGARHVWAQDLAGDTAVDITEQIQRSEHRLVLSDELIRRVGLSAATPGDLSEPGLILQLI